MKKVISFCFPTLSQGFYTFVQNQNNMNELNAEYSETAVKKTPTFLKVLCILTFIGSSFGILSGLSSLLTMKSSINSLKQTEKAMENMPSGFGKMDGLMAATKKWGVLNYVTTIVGSAICLFGAFLMQKLKRNGYFFYLIGSLIVVIPSILFLQEISGSGFMGAMIKVGFVLNFFLCALFITLYSLNYKHLEKN